MEVLTILPEDNSPPDDVLVQCLLCGYSFHFFHRDFGEWTLSCWRCSHTYLLTESLTNWHLMRANLPTSWEISCSGVDK